MGLCNLPRSNLEFGGGTSFFGKKDFASLMYFFLNITPRHVSAHHRNTQGSQSCLLYPQIGMSYLSEYLDRAYHHETLCLIQRPAWHLTCTPPTDAKLCDVPHVSMMASWQGLAPCPSTRMNTHQIAFDLSIIANHKQVNQYHLLPISRSHNGRLPT